MKEVKSYCNLNMVCFEVANVAQKINNGWNFFLGDVYKIYKFCLVFQTEMKHGCK